MNSRDLILSLLSARSPEATVCPSEVARAMDAASSPGNWRSAMPVVHAAVDALLSEEAIKLSWKGKALKSRQGPYRIGRADHVASAGMGKRVRP